MRTISLLLAIAIAASAQRFEESTLKPGMEYIYKYESQVLNGIPGSDNQYAGLRIKSNVRIQYKHDGITLLKFDEVHLCEINSHFGTLLPTEMQSGVTCLPATEHTQVVTEELRKPISFRWQKGVVSHLETDASDPFWSVNIKRGVLNLLQVSLSQETESRDISSELLEEYSEHNKLFRERGLDKFFIVKERDVMGKCDSIYSIHDKLPQLSATESFKVTQIKDYRKCHDKVIFEQGLFSGISTWLSVPKDQQHDLIKPVTSTEYDLVGNRHHFLIRSAKMNSKYIFTPFTTEGGSYVTFMKQHFDLEKSYPIRSEISIPHPELHASALEMHIPHSLATMNKEVLAGKGEVRRSESPETLEKSSKSKRSTSEDKDSYKPRKWYSTRSEERLYRHGKKTIKRDTSEELTKETFENSEESRMDDTAEDTEETSEESEETNERSSEETSEESNETSEESRSRSKSYEKRRDAYTKSWETKRKHGKKSKYDTSEESAEKRYKYSKRTYWEKSEEDTEEVDESSEKIAAMKSLLKEIIASMHPFITEDTTTKIILLTRRLQYLTPGELSTLVLHYAKQSDSVSEVRKIREILLDVLPVVPKPVVPKIIKALAVKGYIYPKRAAYLLSLYSLTAPPTPVALKSLLTVCRCNELTSLDSQLLKTCWLGVGTITHKLNALHIKTRVSKSFSDFAIREVIKDVKKMLSSSTEEKRYLALSVIGNAGLPEFLPEIQHIVSDKSLPRQLRIHAMCSLRRVAILSPGKTLKIVLPVFMNTRESTTLRISALIMGLSARPHASTLELMVHRLRHDSSLEVKSFFYSLISSISQSDLPIHRDVVRTCKHLLLIMKPYDFGVGYSKLYYTDVFSDSTHMGIVGESLMINSPASFLPRVLAFKLGTFFAHQPLHLLDGGMSLRGLDEVFSNVIYAKNVWKKIIDGEFKFSEFLSPYEFSDFGSVRDTIKSIINKVKIEDRSYEKPEIFTWVRLLNNEVTNFYLDRKTITEILFSKEYMTRMFTSSFSSLPVDIVKTLPLVDNSIIIPTPVGLPICLNLTAIVIAHVHGSVTPSHVPSLRELFFSRSLPSEIKLTTDLKSSLAVKAIVSMGVDLTVMKAAAAVKATIVSHFPLSSEITVKPAESKLKITFDIPQERFTVLKAKVKVVTIVKKYPVRSTPIVTVWRDQKELPQRQTLKTIPIQFPIVTPVSAVRFDIVGEVSVRKAAWAPLHPLTCSQSIEIICRASDERAKTVEMKFNFDPSSTVPFVDLYDMYMGSKSTEKSFESEESVESSKEYKHASRSSYRDEDFGEHEFSAIAPWSQIRSPRQSRLSISVKTVGGSRERYAKTLITWTRDPLYLVHHLNAQLIGSSSSASQHEFKAMIDGVVNIPHLLYPTSESLIARLNISCGDRSHFVNDLSIKVMAGSSGYSWSSEHSPLYSYLSSAPSSTEKFEYYAIINYNHHRIPEPVSDFISTYYQLVKVIAYPYLYVRKYDTLTRSPGEIVIYAKCVPAHKKISAVIKTATESDIIIDLPSFNPLFARETLSVRVPAPVHMMDGYSTVAETEDVEETKPRSTWWKPWSAECSVKENIVETFDRVTYKMPESNTACEMIVARDCSHNGLFTIISNPIADKVKILLPHYEIKIHIAPTTYAYDIKINGVAKDITRPLLLSEYPLASSDKVYEITKEGKIVIIRCKKIGLTIKVGNYLSIKTSSLFRGRTCGLCGNFNGQRFDEYEGPSKMIYDKPEYSTIKYMIASEECPVSEYFSKHNIPETVYSEDCRTEMRNVAKVLFRHGERQVCFSTKPEPVCSSGCRRVAATRKHVAFHCLPANELSTEAMVRESKGRVLHELYTKRVDLNDVVDTQEKCVPAA